MKQTLIFIIVSAVLLIAATSSLAFTTRVSEVNNNFTFTGGPEIQEENSPAIIKSNSNIEDSNING